jgi:phosphoglycolate phosphatase-like HAD superfamily hydrolase
MRGRQVGSRALTAEMTEAVQRRHGELYRELLPERRPLPGLVELLADLRVESIVHGIARDLLAARRAGMPSVGLLSGGYGEDEITRAGAFRVYRDAAELRGSLDELGILPGA